MLKNNHVDKIIKVSDFLRALIEARKLKEITLPNIKSYFLRVLIELQDYLDFDEIFSIVIQYKMMETMFMFAESKSLDQDRRDAFALDFFRYSLRQEMIDMTVLVQEMYEEHLMRSTNNCVEALIQAFNKSSRHADIKVHILSKYIEFLKFPQVEGILNAIEKFVCGDKSNSYAITNVNPILSCIKIIHMLI